ncbi:hypothetical protein GCM10009826_32000 [Humibacillus xanthopallidus]
MTSAADAPVASIATPARIARSMTAWAVSRSTPSGLDHIGISSVGGPSGRIARRVLERREGNARRAPVGRVGRSLRATPRLYAALPTHRPRPSRPTSHTSQTRFGGRVPS